MLEDVDKDAGFEKFLDDVVVITRICASMLCFNHFSGNFIRPLEILGNNVCVRANVTKRLCKWVPMSIGNRISRPNTRRDGMKPVDFDSMER